MDACKLPSVRPGVVVNDETSLFQTTNHDIEPFCTNTVNNKYSYFSRVLGKITCLQFDRRKLMIRLKCLFYEESWTQL